MLISEVSSRFGGARHVNHTRTHGWLRAIVSTSVVLHLVVLFWHGAAHAGIPVPLTSLQWTFERLT
jgi:hypothetical protein